MPTGWPPIATGQKGGMPGVAYVKLRPERRPAGEPANHRKAAVTAAGPAHRLPACPRSATATALSRHSTA